MSPLVGKVFAICRVLRERFWARLLATGPVAACADRRRASEVRAAQRRDGLFRKVREAVELPFLPERHTVRGAVWAISVVRNEADIIVPVIEHLFKQGVDAVLIADNTSTDQTPALLSELAERHPVYIAHDSERGHYQGIKMTILADAARRAGADWIVPFDADEFWFAPGGTLAEFLRRSRCKRLRVQMHNLYPVPEVAFGKGAWSLEKQPCEFQKVAFRSHRNATVEDGNHHVHRPGSWSTGPRIVHVPWRSEGQLRNKTVGGADALARTTLDANVGWHWRNLAAMDKQAAHGVWNSILSGELVEGIGWSPGAPALLADPLRWESWDPDGLLC
jgi:hypothetical protein